MKAELLNSTQILQDLCFFFLFHFLICCSCFPEVLSDPLPHLLAPNNIFFQQYKKTKQEYLLWSASNALTAWKDGASILCLDHIQIWNIPISKWPLTSSRLGVGHNRSQKVTVTTPTFPYSHQRFTGIPERNQACVCKRTTATLIQTPSAWSTGIGKQELAVFSDRPQANTSGLKHFTIYHAQRGEGILHAQENQYKKTNKKETTASNLKVATSATGRKRPRQLTTTEHIIEEIGSLLRTRARIMTRREVFFLSLFSAGGGDLGGFSKWHLREVQKHSSRISISKLTFPVSPLPTTL